MVTAAAIALRALCGGLANNKIYTHTVLLAVVYKYCSFFPRRLDILFSHRDIQNCISNLRFQIFHRTLC